MKPSGVLVKVRVCAQKYIFSTFPVTFKISYFLSLPFLSYLFFLILCRSKGFLLSVCTLEYHGF